MTPANVIFLFRLALGAAAILALWFGKSQYDASVRAPVERERDEARAVAESEREAKEWLNGVLVKQAERETKVDQRLEGINRELAALKKNDPAARAVLDTVLPESVIRMSQYAKGAGTVMRDPAGIAPTGNPAAGSPAGSDGGGRAEPQEPAVRGSGEVQQPTGLTGYLGQVWKRLQMKKPAEAGSK